MKTSRIVNQTWRQVMEMPRHRHSRLSAGNVNQLMLRSSRRDTEGKRAVQHSDTQSLVSLKPQCLQTTLQRTARVYVFYKERTNSCRKYKQYNPPCSLLGDLVTYTLLMVNMCISLNETIFSDKSLWNWHIIKRPWQQFFFYLLFEKRNSSSAIT